MCLCFFLSLPYRLSSLTPQIPFGDSFPTNGAFRLDSTRLICAQFSMNIGAHITGFLLFCGRKNTRPSFAPMAFMLTGSFRIRRSGVIATHDLRPHSASQTSSTSSGLKCSSCTRTANPSFSSAVFSCLLPKFRSRKKT